MRQREACLLQVRTLSHACLLQVRTLSHALSHMSQSKTEIQSLVTCDSERNSSPCANQVFWWWLAQNLRNGVLKPVIGLGGVSGAAAGPQQPPALWDLFKALNGW